jgi:hypothetical protein
MKIKSTIKIIFLLVLMFGLNACKHPPQGCTNVLSPNYDPEAELDNGSCIDYRLKYTGTFSFHYFYKFIEYQNPPITTLDSIDYDGAVKLSDLKNCIHVEWKTPIGHPTDFNIDTSGTLTLCGKIVGACSSNKIEIEFNDNVCNAGPLGGASWTELEGEKIN